MRQPEVDAEKIVKHIKYTKHWLDKANKDFQEKNFANGNIVLNLGRAELTAAWEEAMQLKTRIFKKLPQKAKANWKPAASVGLLASGFLIAFFVIQFTQTQVPRPGAVEQVATPAPAAIVQPAPQQNVEAAPAPEAAQPAAAKPAYKPARKRTASAPAAEAAVPSVVPSPAPAEPAPVVSEPEVMPFTPVGHPSAEPHAAPADKTSELGQSEVIDLYKTAERSLRK